MQKSHTYYTYDITLKNGDTLEVRLPFKMSSIMEYKDVLINEKSDRITIGYLADDQDTEDPRESDTFMGSIFTAHRHSKTHRDMQIALGLDRDWEPDLEEILDSDELVEHCKQMIRASYNKIIGSYALYVEALQHVEEQEDYPRGEQESVLDWVLRFFDTREDLEDVMNVDNIALELWKKGREEGTVGKPYAVSLDVYEHGAVCYNVAGRGMQDTFDTARGGAVWIPSDCQVEDIKDSGPIYQKGEIITAQLKSKVFYTIRTFESDTTFDQTVHPEFSDYRDALTYLKALKVTYLRSLRQAELCRAEELAEQDCKTFTDWSNGNCFFSVTVDYDLSGEEIDNETCGGFIGDDYAYSSLKEEFDASI